MTIILSAAAAALALLFAGTRRRLRGLERVRGMLIRALVQDLRGPMAAVERALSRAADEGLDPAQRRLALRQALRGCRSQAELLDTLLDAARLDLGEIRPLRQSVKGGELLESCLGDVAEAAAQLGVSLRRPGAASSLSELSGDENLLRRVFSSVLHDAVRHTPRGGTVSVRARPFGRGVVLEVGGMGAGAAVSSSGGRAGPGGEPSPVRDRELGRRFCDLAVRAHGGRMEVRSQEGRGTRVAIYLPRMSPMVQGGRNP